MNVHFSERFTRYQTPIREAAFHQWTLPDGTLWALVFRRGAGYLLRFPELVDFEVSADGCNVQGWPVPGVTPPTVEHLYINQILPLALSQQGSLVLHGSAVDIEGRGVAFLGESGRGKSTLAASFAAAETRFLTDDVLHLRWLGSRCMIIPSQPSIRLWKDSQQALLLETAAIAPAVSFTTKARLLTGPDIIFCDQARPLHRIFFLGEGDVQAATIEPMRPADVLIDLVKHSFLLDIEDQKVLGGHFDELVRLAEIPIHYRLDYPRDYEALPAARRLIIQHTGKESKAR